MRRFLQFLTTLGVNAVPALGWFVEEWSPATTLAIYWFENIASCLLVAARIYLHQRVFPCAGHFKYAARQGAKRGSSGSFLANFLTISLIFSFGHGFFLTVMVTVLTLNGEGAMAGVRWHSVAAGSGSVLALLVVSFLIDLPTLRKRPFLWIEAMADRNLARVIIVHLTIVLGMFGVALTGATKVFFGMFVGLKTLNDLAGILPQWNPQTPPGWLCRVMDKMPNVHPGETFADFWKKDKVEEIARRAGNEKPCKAELIRER